MRRILYFATAVLLALGLSSAFAHHTPKTSVIDEAAKKQPAVAFDHAKHMTRAKSCDVCHHTDKGLTAKDDAKVKNCAACHLDPKDKAPSMREMSPTKNPFHTLCVGCHKEGKKGPTKCMECHKK